MSERTSYEPGTPCWIDLGTPDQDAAAEFYGALFGWSVEADENAEQTGGYRVAMLGDKAIGGVMKLMEEGQPPAWSTYIAVEDADATVAKVKEAGGAVVFEPMTVLDYGRMAFIADPTRRRRRHLAAREEQGRRPRQRAGRLLLGRAQHPRRRRRQVLLPRCLRLGARDRRPGGGARLLHDDHVGR